MTRVTKTQWIRINRNRKNFRNMKCFTTNVTHCICNRISIHFMWMKTEKKMKLLKCMLGLLDIKVQIRPQFTPSEYRTQRINHESWERGENTVREWPSPFTYTHKIWRFSRRRYINHVTERWYNDFENTSDFFSPDILPTNGRNMLISLLYVWFLRRKKTFITSYALLTQSDKFIHSISERTSHQQRTKKHDVLEVFLLPRATCMFFDPFHVLFTRLSCDRHETEKHFNNTMDQLHYVW